ncbi:Clp protease N-terminal domain-containing protein [Streptomyces sp. G45]|uniref:Clp protease N-terminal domain-containing protein n=1 Tax=Streptomyces sp. G45 TaxID=3406627 RepID=UPI003C264E22
MARPNDEPLIHTAAWNQVVGSADTLARFMGHEAVNPEHLVLAVLLDPDQLASQVLATIADREQVVAALREAIQSTSYSRSAVAGEESSEKE